MPVKGELLSFEHVSVSLVGATRVLYEEFKQMVLHALRYMGIPSGALLFGGELTRPTDWANKPGQDIVHQ